MADYFAALAKRTLRPDLSVRPRPRVRWEDAIEPTVHSSPATEEQLSAAEPPRALDSDEPPRRLHHELAADRSRQEDEQVDRRPKRARESKAAVDPEASTDRMAVAPHPTVRAAEPALQVRFERVVTPAIEAPGTSPAAARDRAETTARIGGTGPAHPRVTRRSMPEREVETAIRIHIGRVDVRAVTSAAPGPSPSATRDSKRELMSIDEYVQKRDRGAS